MIYNKADAAHTKVYIKVIHIKMSSAFTVDFLHTATILENEILHGRINPIDAEATRTNVTLLNDPFA